MLDYLKLKPEAFGLDFSDLSLRIVKLKKKRDGFEVFSFGETVIPEGIIRKGEIKKEDSLVKIIKKTVANAKENPLKTKYVVASLPERKAFIQVIKMPFLSEEDLKSAIIFEAENYIPLPVEEMYLDFQIIPSLKNNLNHHDILLVALPKKTVDSYLSVLKAAGLKPLALEIESFSVVRSLIKEENTKEPILILDLGPTRSTFIIFSGNSLRCSFSIPVCAKDLTEAVSRVLKIDFQNAQKIKLKCGLEKEGKEGKEVFDAMIPPLVDLNEQIKKYLDYYHTHTANEYLPFGERKVRKVFLSGEESNLKGLADFLAKQLSLEVKMGDPWINILTENQKKIIEPSAERSPAFTAALGLALRAVKNND